MSLLSLFNQLYASLMNKSISFLKNVTDLNGLNGSLYFLFTILCIYLLQFY